MEQQTEQQKELQAQKLQAQSLLGDKEPIKVKCSNSKTYAITRTKIRVTVLASEQFMHTKQVKPLSKKLNAIQKAIADTAEEDLEGKEKLLKDYEELNKELINEFLNSTENSEYICKAIAYIILNDHKAIQNDEFTEPRPLGKFFGAKAKRKPDKERLWYELYTELDYSDVFNLFVAATKKFNTDVFFYTMGLIQSLDNLKAQSPAEL